MIVMLFMVYESKESIEKEKLEAVSK